MTQREDIDLRFNTAPQLLLLSDPPTLRYDLVPYAPTPGHAPQSVLNDRTVLEPQIDFSRYRCEAVIDFIEFQLVTLQATQPVHIQKTARKALEAMGSSSSVYVELKGGAKYTWCRSYYIRIQQPRPRELERVLAAIDARYPHSLGSASKLPVTAIEVSVDFYVKDIDTIHPDTAQILRWQMTEVLKRHFLPERSVVDPIGRNGLPRIGKGDARFFPNEKGHTGFVVDRKRAHPRKQLMKSIREIGLDRRDGIALHLDAHHQPPIDATYYVGERGLVHFRIMDKTTDRRQPVPSTADPLGDDQKRSRIEFSFHIKRGLDIPGAFDLDEVGKLHGFDFFEMRRAALHFVKPTIGDRFKIEGVKLQPGFDEWRIFSRSGAYGLDRIQRLQHRACAHCKGDMGWKGRAVSFEDLNRKVDRATDRLTRYWGS
ncbi:hypothetical protein [Anianabacter salinae]|uniref:hypothetical protein n=1 Tax=Anianabacter salinae TaxID=2851023 RepID=UPI00225DF445|nr:hypothetical protein [Anianabacter salinae]MBV0912506.1 hypothetical protein [Anianabacter salinae]